MAPKVPYFTKLDPDLREAMRRYKARVGVPEAQQVERALLEWLGQRQEAWPLPGRHEAPRRQPNRGRATTAKRRSLGPRSRRQ